MKLKIYTDGGSKGNPGPSSIGVICYAQEKELFRISKKIGVTTNNIAEYTAVFTALTYIKENLAIDSINEIDIYSDSKLLVNQLNGLFKVKNAKIQQLIFEIRALEVSMNVSVQYHHIKREKNIIADSLVNSS